MLPLELSIPGIIKQGFFSFTDMMSSLYLFCDIYNIKKCNKIASLRKNENETINLTICKTEFRENVLFKNNLA